jgi:ATP adenylyltransferase
MQSDDHAQELRPSARDGSGLTLLDAPWRHKYFDQPKGAGCFISAAVKASPEHDAENLLLVRGERAVILLNRYPYTMGALMVAPIAHVGRLQDLDDDTLLEMMQLVKRGMAILDHAIHPKAYNIGINQGVEAGAGLSEHLHIHVVPRWGADTNFMTTIGNARVLAEDVDGMYQRLKRAMQELETQDNPSKK